MAEKRSPIRINTEEWNQLVYVPVMAGINLQNMEDLEDARHVTSFILSSLFAEMGQVMQHLAYNESSTDFACMAILSSAAPKGVYDALCPALLIFAKQVTRANGLPKHTRTRMRKYLASLEQERGARLCLMFIRDAAYISAPSNTRQLSRLAKQVRNQRLTDAAIEQHLKLLTMAMCSDALGTPKMSNTGDLKAIVPTLIRSLESGAGCRFICHGDLLSGAPAIGSSLSARKFQIVEFLSRLF
jgi:hypothetical protein